MRPSSRRSWLTRKPARGGPPAGGICAWGKPACAGLPNILSEPRLSQSWNFYTRPWGRVVLCR